MSSRTPVALTLVLLSGCAAPSLGPQTTVAEPQTRAIAPARVAAASTETIVVDPAGTSDDVVICRRERVTGSHQKREICATRAERRTRQRDAQEWHRSGGLRGGVSSVPTVR